MYNTYLLLNIFLDRSNELTFLEILLNEERRNKHVGKKEWLKQAKKRFFKFVRNLEKMRRRDKKNHEIRSYKDAKKIFEKLQKEQWLLPKKLQKRLDYIDKHWEQFTLFHQVKNCPHTNNILENYFSTSLKTHRKKQLRPKFDS